MEQYSWRAQEQKINSTIPQFRTAFTVPNHPTPIRTHFIHVRSPQFNAVPLLLIPSFPLTNLSYTHIIRLFTHPGNAKLQSFHLVIPSLPGLGFSDALPNNTPVVSTTGEMLNSLMVRLGYEHYIATNVGPGAASPAEIDWHLANYLATQLPNNCLGVNFISPPLEQPTLKEGFVEWAKWSLASLFQVPMMGYLNEDFEALERNHPAKKAKKTPTPTEIGLNQMGLREPNTLAYALCDSPTGLLVYAMKTLAMLSPRRKFTPTELINFTQFAWIPGPESALRFWAYCSQHPEIFTSDPKSRPRVAITVFLGDQPGATIPETSGEGTELQALGTSPSTDGYACPSWANSRYHVVHTCRASGRPGFLAWERPEVITAGVRNLAREILKLDPRLRQDQTFTSPLTGVVSFDSSLPMSPGSGGMALGSGAFETPPETPMDAALQPTTPVSESEKSSPPATVADDRQLAPIPEERLHPPRSGSNDEIQVAAEGEQLEEKQLKEKGSEILAVAIPEAPTPIPAVG